jgi:hypothetical protein
VSNELIKYAFTAGEISPTLYGRSDLEQYDLGLALARNWFVDYRGGLSTRAGFAFCEFIMDDDKPTKYFDFRFSPDLSNIYLLLFGDHYVRFLQDGAYVLEAAKIITALASGTFTSVAHGFAVGDWIKLSGLVGPTNLNGRTFEIASVTTDTFTLKTVPSLAATVPVGAYVSGGTASRIYTVTTPYAAEDLEGLSANQRRDLLRLTHDEFPIYNLTRNDATDWDLTEDVRSSGFAYIQNLTATASAAGAAGTLFVVTALFEDGTESVKSPSAILRNIVNYTVTEGSVKLNWDIFPGAVAYNVYRSIVASSGASLTRGFELGFIGKVVGTQFVDSNIIPDFTKTPPVPSDPFMPRQIISVTITAQGTGYDDTTGIVVTDSTGTEALLEAVVDSAGKLIAVNVLFPGKNYTAPTITVTGTGTGATATATLSEATGVYPAISSVFQQRQLYAATINEPLTLWASRPGKYGDFSYSDVTLDNDAYEFEVDSSEVAPLRHMVPMRGGLVLMSQTGVWQLTGGNGGVVTPTNALADPQTYSGVSAVVPLKIGPDILYIEGKGYTVRLLSYNEYAKVYAGEDKSILSNHFFSAGKRLTSWAFAESPYKVVYGVRSDGALLNFTVVKEEKVAAWTSSATKGKFVDCRVVQENDLDTLYVATSRKIDGRQTKFIERAAPREFDFTENAFCVDCGLALPVNAPAANLDASSTEGEVTFTASSAVFVSGDVDRILRMGGGKAHVTEYLSATQIKAQVIRPITDVVFEDPEETVNTQLAGTWTLDTPVTNVGGLWHLEGETVTLLGDGNVMPEQTVVNGSIVLEHAVTRLVVGIPFTCVARTLSPVVSDAVIEARRKRVVGVAARVNDTVGLSTGESLDNLYDAKERSTELYGEPIELFSGVRVQLIEPVWDESGQTYFVQSNPLPATLLGLVLDIEVGDDPN